MDFDSGILSKIRNQESDFPGILNYESCLAD